MSSCNVGLLLNSLNETHKSTSMGSMQSTSLSPTKSVNCDQERCNLSNKKFSIKTKSEVQEEVKIEEAEVT